MLGYNMPTGRGVAKYSVAKYGVAKYSVAKYGVANYNLTYSSPRVKSIYLIGPNS